MTRESDSGSRTPEGPDAFSPTTQLATFADDEARWNNFARVANASARNALVAPELRDGILVEDLDTHMIWQRVGSGWVLITQPGCALRKSASQNLSTTPTALAWDAEISDPAGMHDNSTNPSRVTAPQAGLYRVEAQLYNNNTSGAGTVLGRLNGTTDVPGSAMRRTAGSAEGTPLLTVFPVAMAAGDYLEIMVSHSTATGQIAGGTTSLSAVLTMTRIGAV